MSRTTLIVLVLVVLWYFNATRDRAGAPVADPCPGPEYAPWGPGGFCAPVECPPTYVRVPPRGDCVPNGTRIY